MEAWPISGRHSYWWEFERNASGHNTRLCVPVKRQWDYHGKANNFVAKVKPDYFPYLTQGKDIRINAVQSCAIKDKAVQSATLQGLDLDALSHGLGKILARLLK